MEWLHGVENITAGMDGYIYWKGKEIEHFTRPLEEKMKPHTVELARRCKLLESRRKEINTTSVVWQWDESGKGDKWEIAFYNCDAPAWAKEAAKRICMAYGIEGVCDPAYIANVINNEHKGGDV